MQKQSEPKSSSLVFKMGKFTFSYPKDHSKKKPIHKEAIKNIKKEDSDTLDISWGKYKRHKWDNILKRIIECEVERVSAYGNSDKNILLTLSRISFYNLSHLDLGQCLIENIQNLPTGPSLCYLSLINNNIYSIQALKKFPLPGLKTLLLSKELGIGRCEFKLESFWLERKYNFKTIKECLGQTCLFKLKHEQIKDISIESVGRIHQPNHIQKIHDKFPQLRTIFYIEPEDLFDSDNQFVIYLSEEEVDQEDDEIPMQVVEINDTEFFEPPALKFVEGDEEETWIEDSKTLQAEKTVGQQGLNQTEEKEIEIDGSSDEADDEQETDEMEEGESSDSSTSRWDSGLEEEDEIDEEEDVIDEEDNEDENDDDGEEI